MGAESFFADGSIIGGRRTHRRACHVSHNTVGRRSFVGNNAILPVDMDLGENCLIGAQSIPPIGSPRTQDGSEWVGSPAFALTHRAKVGNFDNTVTFQPTAKLYIQRAIVDACRILIPGYIALGFFIVWAAAFIWLILNPGLVTALALAPILGLMLSLSSIVVVAALKAVVMGTYHPEIKPLWSMYVWLNEMVNGAYESVAGPAMSPLLGTPFIAPFLRLMGVRLGRRTFIASTHFSEWDLVEIGDYAALNHGAVIQNHLFEDRVFKSSYLRIGEGASVGNMSVILYDSETGNDALVGPLSLLMKGETLLPGTRWHGIPTEQMPQGHAREPTTTSVLR